MTLRDSAKQYIQNHAPPSALANDDCFATTTLGLRRTLVSEPAELDADDEPMDEPSMELVLSEREMLCGLPRACTESDASVVRWRF